VLYATIVDPLLSNDVTAKREMAENFADSKEISSNSQDEP
jgi:hypothetical protein